MLHQCFDHDRYIIQLSKLYWGLHYFISTSSLLEDHLVKHPLKFYWALRFTTWLLATKVFAKLYFHTCWAKPPHASVVKTPPKIASELFKTWTSTLVLHILIALLMLILLMYLDSLDSLFVDDNSHELWIFYVISVNLHEALLKFAIEIFNSSSLKALAF